MPRANNTQARTVAAVFSGVRHFKPHEFNAPERMDHDFLMRLDAARSVAGIPFVVSHVRQFRPGDDGDHGQGTGVDIRCHDSRSRYIILTAALAVGFNRIGVYNRHIHVGSSPVLAPNVVWVGKSQ